MVSDNESPYIRDPLEGVSIPDAARQAAEYWRLRLPEPDVIVTRDDVYESGDFPPAPTGLVTVDQYQAWRLAAMQFIDQWRRLMLDMTGRDPVTVPGSGFRFLAPGDVVPHAASEVFDTTFRALRHFARKSKAVSTGRLAPEERRRAIDEEARVGRLQTILARAMRRQGTK